MAWPSSLFERRLGRRLDGIHQGDAGPGEAKAFMVPETEGAAGEVGVIDDGVETVGGAVGAGGSGAVAGIAGGIEERSPVADPVFVGGNFERGHSGVDVDPASGDGIEIIVAQGLIESVAEIDAANVAVAGPAQVVGADGMRIHVAVYHRAGRGGTDQESVVVVVDAGVVAVVVKAEFGGVALGEKILDVDVGDVDLLSAILKCVQAAVRILLEEVEPGEIVGQAVGTQIAENPHSGLLFGEQEPAKVAGELLDAGTNRNEIIVRTQIADLGFDEGFLQSHVSVEAIDSFPRVHVYDAALAGLQEVEVDLGREAHAKINRTEGSIATEQIERETQDFA